MNISIYKNKLYSASQRLNLMTCLVFFLGVSNIMIGGLAWYTSIHQKTYVTPFFGGNGFNVSDGAVDSNYINIGVGQYTCAVGSLHILDVNTGIDSKGLQSFLIGLNIYLYKLFQNV